MIEKEQCKFEFAPGVRCQMELGHDEPFYYYHDYGQYGEYSDTLSRGSAHQVHASAPPVPPREEWTGKERKDRMSLYPSFFRRED